MSPHASRPQSGTRVARLGGLLVLCLALFAGCQTDASVIVDLHANGSGVVRVQVVLDAQAVGKVGDLSEILSVDDLKKAGWTLTGPGQANRVVREAGALAVGGGATSTPGYPAGSVGIVLSRRFANVGQANMILASLSGPKGPLSNVHLTRSTSFSATKLSATGTVDLSNGFETFGDAPLSKALGGRSLTEVAGGLSGSAAPTGNALSVRLLVVPHGLKLNGDTGNAQGSSAVGSTATLGAKPAGFDVHGSQTHWVALLLALLGVLALVAAAGTLVVQLLPGRGAPLPPRRKRQLHSGSDGWEYVENRAGIDTPTRDRPRRGKHGRHSRPRGAQKRWVADEIEIGPLGVPDLPGSTPPEPPDAHRAPEDRPSGD